MTQIINKANFNLTREEAMQTYEHLESVVNICCDQIQIWRPLRVTTESKNTDVISGYWPNIPSAVARSDSRYANTSSLHKQRSW